MDGSTFHDFGGKPIAEAQLRGLIRKLHSACKANSSCEVVEARQHDSLNFQTIVVDFADGTFDIANPVGIRRVERLAISFREDQSFPLEVRALRKAFPVTSFRQHTGADEPKMLCLYLAAWKAVERTWTPELYIARILWWLRSTADGTIHNSDQPGEHMFFASRYTVVLPRDFFGSSEPKKLAFNEIVNEQTGAITLIGQYKLDGEKSESSCLSLSLLLDPVEAGPMEEMTYNLGSLDDLLGRRSTGLVSPLKTVIQEHVTSDGIFPKKDEFVLVILGIPKQENGKSSGFECQGFIANAGLCDLGVKLSVLVRSPVDGKYFRESPLSNSNSDAWRAIEIEQVNIRSYPDEKTVRRHSGLSSDDQGPTGIIAGVGALGGLLARIWNTECWGNWYYIDPDTIQAHNITRHIASHHAVGFSKAPVVCNIVNGIHPTKVVASDRALVEEIDSSEQAVVAAISRSSFVVDTTTTLHIPRVISKRDEFPRTASAFLTPSGASAVLLMESGQREIRCNHLEAQYYRAVLNSVWGENHLKNHLGKFSVGGGCREVTVALSNEIVHLHSGNLARQIRKRLASPEAMIGVWEYQEETGATLFHDIPVFAASSLEIGGWTVVWDEGFLRDARELRSHALPSETGGVLLGIVDQVDMTITLVQASPSPSGSKEAACTYTRAGYETDEFMKNCLNRTAEIVTYVGEWHSHPEKVPPLPSKDDVNQHAFVYASLSREGQPALMMIVSDCSVGFYINGLGAIVNPAL